jgi:anti-anti-sigma factor
MSSPLSVEQYQVGGVVRLAVAGEIDEDVTEVLTAAIFSAVGEDEVTQVLVDLRGVTFLAAAGIRDLLEGRAEVLRHGCGYRVINADGLVLWVLNVTRTEGLLNPADVDAAELATCPPQSAPPGV